MLRLRAAKMLMVSATFVAAVQPATAQQTYASKAQVINAGVVVLESSRANSTSQPVAAAPHAWFNLDRNRSVKPAGWVIENPHPNTVLSGSLYDRWNAIETGLGNPALTPGSRISKRNAPYWEVRLSQLTDEQLGDYDVLLVSPLYRVQLNPSEREKLRHFVDRGGVLWIDPAGLPASTGIDEGNSFPTPFGLSGISGAAQFRDLTQPLLTTPLTLTDRDFGALTPNAITGAYARDIVAPTSASLTAPNLFGDSLADWLQIKPVVGVSTTQYSIGVTRIGDGYVVITGHGASLHLNRVRTLNNDGTPNYALDANWGYTARNPDLESDGIAAAKLAINMISLGREYSQPQGGSQKNSSSAIDIGAPLIIRSSDARLSGIETAPVLYKGYVVVTAGNTVQVFDADPARDIDGDGNPNDGDQNDGGFGDRDLIWESSSLGSGLSTPVCVEVSNGQLNANTAGVTHRVTDYVLTVDGNGTLYALDLIAYDANGRLSGAARGAVQSINPPGSGSSSQPANGVYRNQPLAPTVHEGTAYIAEPISSNSAGRFWMVDLATMTLTQDDDSNEWYYGAGKGGLPPFAAPPTVGYIPILDNSGGFDKVLYAPTARITGLGSSPAGLVSIWLGAKGERPTSYEVSAGSLVITTRAAGSQLPIYMADRLDDPRAVRVSLLREDGSVYSAAETTATLGTITESQGILNVTLRTTDLPADVTGIRVDYTIDLGADQGALTNVVRGNIQIPDIQTGPVRDIRGSVALSPNGTIFFTTSPENTSSLSRAAVFAYREEGRGAFKCLMRYELYPQYTAFSQGVADQTVPPVFSDNDEVVRFAPSFLNQPFSAFTIPGPPAIRGNVAYVVAAGYKGFVPTTVVMAFPADPPQPSIRLDDFPDGSVILQQDLARSTVNRRPELANVYSVAQVPGMTYDPETKLLKFDSLSTAQKGQQQAVLSLSQPIVVRRAGSGDSAPFFPNSQDGNTFDPLLWYTVYNGLNATSTGLAVTGNTLFTSGTSRLRSVLTSGAITPVEGMMYGLDVSISANDEFLTAMPSAPWRQQLCQLKTVGGNLAANPAQKWPQMTNINDLDDYLVRLNQTLVPGSADNADVRVVYGMAAGEGVLSITSKSGLHTYARSDFYIADQGRIATFDPSGNPTFAMGVTATVGEDDSGNAGRATPLVNPTRVYPLADNSMLVVDAGKDRIFRVDRAGIESRSISTLRLDPTIRPSGYPANGPLSLKAPRDVVHFTTIESPASLGQLVTDAGASAEYWEHYVIADSGNHRLIEVVDRYAYDLNTRRVGAAIRIGGVPQLGVMTWHSPATVSDKGYVYNSVSRVLVDGRYVYFAGIGANMPSSFDSGAIRPTPASERGSAGFGGVAIFDSALPGGVKVFNQVRVPQIDANVFWNETAGSFSSPARPQALRRLVNVQSVTARTFTNGTASTIRVMICDGNGVSEVEYSPASVGDFQPDVVWQLPNEVYRVIRRSGAGDGVPTAANPGDLRATYARRLETGEVLVVNGYFGQTRGTRNADGTFSGRTPFRGEVLQISGESGGRWGAVNMGFGLRSITFNLELASEARGLVLPVFAFRR